MPPTANDFFNSGAGTDLESPVSPVAGDVLLGLKSGTRAQFLVSAVNALAVALANSYTDTEIAEAIAAHVALADPHSQYATDTDLANHVAAADPHTGYQLESEKGAASGYPSLNSFSRVEQDVHYPSAPVGVPANSLKGTIDLLLGVRIVEKSSNANGHYIRWENGLQICYRTDFPISFSASATVTFTWNFPAAFLDSDVSGFCMSQGGDLNYTMEFINQCSTTQMFNSIARIPAAQTANRNLRLLAIGAWK